MAWSLHGHLTAENDTNSPAEAVHYGDQCWSRALIDWQAWKDEGKTGHRNWWPDLYRAYCTNKASRPTSKVLAFDTSYQTKRADLKQVAVST